MALRPLPLPLPDAPQRLAWPRRCNPEILTNVPYRWKQLLDHFAVMSLIQGDRHVAVIPSGLHKAAAKVLGNSTPASAARFG